MAKNITQSQIWHKILRHLNKQGLDYVLVGGAALVVHGIPRSTVDMDVYVHAEESVLARLFQMAKVLGLKCEQAAIRKIERFPELFVDQWICFSYRNQDVLDVYFAPRVILERLLKHSTVKRDKKLSIRVASLDDMAAMKKAAGKPIDIADLRLIEEAKKLGK